MRNRKNCLSRLPFVNLFIILATLLPIASGALALPQDSQSLLPGLPIEREVTAGSVHVYRLQLDANQYLRLVVAQQGMNVAVKLAGPDGRILAEADRAGGARGSEVITVIADAAGEYRLEVRAQGKDGEAGRYEVKIEEQRAATAQDRDRIAADRAMEEGDDLLGGNSEESLKKAFEKFHEALLLYRALGDKKGEGAALDNMGWTTHLLGDTRKAIEFYDQSLPLRRDTGDRDGEILTLLGIGLAYNALGERRQAIETYQQALALSRELQKPSQEAAALNNIGGICWAHGEYQKALDYYTQALPLQRQAGNRSGEASILNNIGDVYRMLGDADKALEYFNQALAIRKEIGDRRGQGVSLQTTALVYHLLLNDQQKALDTFTQALAIRKETGDRIGQAYSLGGTGSVYAALGQPQKALEYQTQSLALWREVGVRRGEAQALLHIGEIYASQGDAAKALEYFQQSLDLNRALGEQVFVAQALAGIARVERDRDNLAAARTNIEEALNIVESLRSKVAGQELRASYFASVREYYDFHIDVLMRLHESNPTARYDAAALHASERARSRSLLEMLNEAGADIREGVAPALLARERELREQLNGKAERLSRLLGDKKMAA
ncbi:MAG TPA: tetratricopeptide repeat protein, partial [Blastocatellia bacterium]|nr:tetratricopeptide repeat protein [Blastocatellia bacterium]